MESTKHSLQEHLLLATASSSSCSSLLDSSSCYSAAVTGAGSHGCWSTPNTILSSGTFGSYVNGGGAIVSSRNNPRLQNDNILASSFDTSMNSHQDLSFHWAAAAESTVGSCTTDFSDNPSHDLLQLSQIKQELSDSYSKFSEMISSSPSSTIEDMHNNSNNRPATCYGKKEQRDINDINVKLFLKTLSSGSSSPEEDAFSNSSSSSPSSSLGQVPSHRGTFSQIYPTINVSNLSQTSIAGNLSNTFDMNLQVLDLFHSAASFGNGNLRQSLQDQVLGLPSNGLSYGLDYMKQSIQRPLNSSTMTHFTSGSVAEAKRTEIEPKAPQATAAAAATVSAKRSRLESRASCPPFKVRKEKLGDRIAALQQLVAPFGKTDTASVLMEAIGYIKFLQNQVETLSVPYLKSSRNKTHRAAQGGLTDNGSEEKKRDLRSRGLCLVPLSCLSYMTESGGAVWPPPNFTGGT